MVNIEDGIKVAGLEGKMTAIDLAELVEQQIIRKTNPQITQKQTQSETDSQIRGRSDRERVATGVAPSAPESAKSA
jgi:hypothetical protein